MSEGLAGSSRSVGRGTGRGTVTSTSPLVSKVAKPTGVATASPTPPPKRLPAPTVTSPKISREALVRESSGTLAAGRAKPLPPAKPAPTKQNSSQDLGEENSAAPAPKTSSSTTATAKARSSAYGMARVGPPPDIKAKPISIATEDYDAENHREISFKKDERIYVTFWSPHTSWWKGWCNGSIGYFPKEFVKTLFDVEQTVDVEEKKKTVRSADTQDKKRRQLIMSIVSTEEQYVKDLQMIPELIAPQFSGLVSSADYAEIFQNVEKICAESKANLTLFNRKAKTDEPVGDVFLKMAELFDKEVVSWAENQGAVVCLMERLSFNSPEFQQRVEELISEKLGGMTIYELFARPVRRALESCSIVKMLLLKTPQDNADFKDLTEALEVFNHVKDALRVYSEDIENRLKIVAVQSALQGQESLVTPGRKLVREYSVQEVLRGGKKASERKIMILTDVLVVVKVKRTGYGQGSVYPLTKATAVAINESAGNLKHIFELTVAVGPKKEKRRFAMNTATDRDAFLNALASQAAQTAQTGPVANLSRESSATLAGQGSSESLPKKGIFQKLRSTRTLSIGGDEGPPEHLKEGPSSSSSGPSMAVSPGSASTSSVSPRPPPMTRASSSTLANSRSPRDKIVQTRESSPRAGAAEDRKSPRSWASASSNSAVVSAVEETSSSSSASASASATGETTTTLARGSSVTCAACGENVVGSALSSKGKFFHSTCYKCQECSKSLLGIPFAEKRGEVYCRDCALSLFAEPCSGCGKMITGQFLSAFGEKYHPACFVCAGCSTNVSRGYAKRNGKAYCRNCAKEKKDN